MALPFPTPELHRLHLSLQWKRDGLNRAEPQPLRIPLTLSRKAERAVITPLARRADIPPGMRSHIKVFLNFGKINAAPGLALEKISQAIDNGDVFRGIERDTGQLPLLPVAVTYASDDEQGCTDRGVARGSNDGGGSLFKWV